jgi:spore coat polysaccharide biosynthesis protein SpsF
MIINVSIEARMTSSRLPGKVLKKINGIPNLEVMITRVKKIQNINSIIVATTNNIEDDLIVQWCIKNNVSYFRGSENNVYDRVLQTHKQFNSDVVIELTGDCPLIDPQLVEQALYTYKNNNYDYVSNSLEEGYPLGMAIQIYSYTILKSISTNRILEYQDKEHVTPYLYTSGKYNIFNIKADKKHYMPSLSVTLDTINDFHVIENIMKNFNNLNFTLEEIIIFSQQNPTQTNMNQNTHRKGLN